MPGWRSAVGVTAAVLSAFGLAGLLATSAWPRMHAGPNQLEAGHRLQGAIAPLDGTGSFATPAAAYSLRRLKSTYTGPGIRLRRASDNAEADIGFLGFTGFTGAPLNVAQANTHCAATTCTVATWYDQSGNARDGTRAPAQQPSFVFACAPNGQPCLRSSSSGQLLGAPTSAVANPVTLNGVAIRTSGVGQCNWPMHYEAGNFLATSVANQWVISGAGALGAAAADAAWHTGIGVFNGAASVLRIDATEGTGTLTANTTASSLLPFYGADTTVCSVVEVVWWSGYALTAGERSALTANQRSFWGF